MRTILFSLTTLFAISITGCLDDAQQPESNQRLLATEQHPEAMEQAGVERALPDMPDHPIAIQDEIDDSGASDSAPVDETDPMFCKTVADCEPGYGCRLDLHKCMLDTH